MYRIFSATFALTAAGCRDTRDYTQTVLYVFTWIQKTRNAHILCVPRWLRASLYGIPRDDRKDRARLHACTPARRNEFIIKTSSHAAASLRKNNVDVDWWRLSAARNITAYTAIYTIIYCHTRVCVCVYFSHRVFGASMDIYLFINYHGNDMDMCNDGVGGIVAAKYMVNARIFVCANIGRSSICVNKCIYSMHIAAMRLFRQRVVWAYRELLLLLCLPRAPHGQPEWRKRF